MLLTYNCILLKMSTWYSKHVEESIWRINNIKCITLVFLVWSKYNAQLSTCLVFLLKYIYIYIYIFIIFGMNWAVCSLGLHPNSYLFILTFLRFSFYLCLASKHTYNMAIRKTILNHFHPSFHSATSCNARGFSKISHTHSLSVCFLPLCPSFCFLFVVYFTMSPERM